MKGSEIETLLNDALNKLKLMEKAYCDKITEFESRIEYLEEKCSSQERMLIDSVNYIKKLESKKK